MPLNLEELKAENEAKAKAKAKEGVIEKVLETEVEVEVEVDEDGKPIVPVEPWQKVEEQDSTAVPVTTHINVKRKLKGRIAEKEDKISELEAEVQRLKSRTTISTPELEAPKRPKAADYDSGSKYEEDLAKYEESLVEIQVTKALAAKTSTDSAGQHKKALDESVDSHYSRAEKLLEMTGIEPEVYKKADGTVRKSIEVVRPGFGDLIVDQLISVLGEGSEKVMYYIGRNAVALERVKGLLVTDPSGMKAAIFLGQQLERLTNTQTHKSLASKPAPIIQGDASGGSQAAALKKQYAAAHKKGDHQAAYNAKKEAKKLKADVSTW